MPSVPAKSGSRSNSEKAFLNIVFIRRYKDTLMKYSIAKIINTQHVLISSLRKSLFLRNIMILPSQKS
jgi:hypothetical protein